MTADELIARIERAFPVEPRPGDDDLAPHVCAECDEIRSVLRGARWTDLSDVVIDRHFDQLPLLTPDAFCYYLPAHLRRAVRDPELPGVGLGQVLSFTVYALCDRKLPADPWWRERVERFTPEQAGAIVAYLRWVVGRADESDVVDAFEVAHARRGLEQYWNARAPDDTPRGRG